MSIVSLKVPEATADTSANPIFSVMLAWKANTSNLYHALECSEHVGITMLGQDFVFRQASFIKLRMVEQQSHVSCVGMAGIEPIPSESEELTRNPLSESPWPTTLRGR